MRNYLLKGLALTLLLLAGPAVAERVALVIGNNAYQHGGALNHAVGDAQQVGDALQGLGFRVLRKQDLDYSGLLDALDELGKAATGADWAVVYYAGHGIQVQGKNHLIPVDVGLNREGDLRRTVLLEDLLTEVNQAQELGLVILDACRDNPFAARLNQGTGRSVAGRGLARVEQTGGNTLVAFTTREDDIAADTGVYAAALVQHLATPGLELRQLFGKVRDEVMARTGNTQQPYTYGSLGGGYYAFKPGPSRPPEASRDPEVVFWDSVKDSRNPAVFRIYLERYPSGTFAKLAQIRLVELEPPKSPVPSPAPVVKPPATERVALVIGNSHYQHASVLANTGNDARAVAEALQKLGFTLDGGQAYRDLSKTQLEQVLKTFGLRARDAEAVVVYYAGHGVESGGANYLVPVDAALQYEVHLPLETVALDTVLDQIGGPRGWRLVILDACRNNPLAARMVRGAGGRGVTRGLARVEPQGQTYVAFAAKAGTECLDQDPAGSDHSPFAAVLLDYLSQPLPLERLFGAVREDVLKRTGGRQEPSLYGAFGRDPIYLKDSQKKPEPPPSPPAVGREAVWNPPEGKWEAIYSECALGYGEVKMTCIASGMKQAGASSQAIAFTELMHKANNDVVYMNSYKEMGTVDVAEVTGPVLNDPSTSYFILVNGIPRIIELLDKARNVDLKKDRHYQSFSKKFPKIMLWGSHHDFEKMESLPQGGQRFIFKFLMLNGCHACEIAGWARIAFDFDQSGRLIATNLIGLKEE